MAKFMVRVELHGANSLDYSFLHMMMASYGFARTIVGDNGLTYALPTAMYVIESYADVMEITRWAKSAAQATGRGSWVIANEYTSASWFLDQTWSQSHLSELYR